MTPSWYKPVMDAIQKAVDAASRQGVSVEIAVTEYGFFPTERTEIKITAKKQPQGEPK